MSDSMDELKYFNGKFPRTALEDAVANQKTTTEVLLKDLDDVLADPDSRIDEDSMLHFYAIFLLAQFRETRACQRILALFSLDPDQVESLFGDAVTEGLNSIVYSTFDGDLGALETVIENPKVGLYVRGAILEVYGKLYTDGVVSKEIFISYLRELLKNKGGDYDSDLATPIQGLIVDLKLFEMVDDVQALHDAGRIDEKDMGKYDGFIDEMYNYSYTNQSVDYIDDAIAMLARWGMYEQLEEDEAEKNERMEKLEAELKKISEEDIKAEKVGRNDPCPCGSGKKYKKCCLKKDQAYRSKKQEPAVEQRRWLRDYPMIEGERKEGEIRITDTFDEESIEIDRLVYLGLHRRSRPMWEETDHEKEDLAKSSYLFDAFEKFKAKIEKEAIQSFEEYDRKYKIHYRSSDWMSELRRKADQVEFVTTFGDRSDELDEVIEQLGG